MQPSTRKCVQVFMRQRLARLNVVGRPRRVAIAVPIKNEAEGISGCLAALDRAAASYAGSVSVVAFANDCIDRSIERIAAFQPAHFDLDLCTTSLVPGARHAGWARRLAFDAATTHLVEDTDLLLSTDADSHVDPAWLARTVAHVDAGYDAVAGMALTPARDRATLGDVMRRRMNLLGRYGIAIAHLRRRAEPGSRDPWPRHDYEGGASIALTLAAYRRIGGAPTPPLAEDRALFAAVRATGGRVRHAVDVRVFTSCRFDGRAPGGMADTLARWAAQDEDAPVHETYTVAAMLGHAPRGPGQQLSFGTLPHALATAQRAIRESVGQSL